MWRCKITGFTPIVSTDHTVATRSSLTVTSSQNLIHSQQNTPLAELIRLGLCPIPIRRTETCRIKPHHTIINRDKTSACSDPMLPFPFPPKSYSRQPATRAWARVIPRGAPHHHPVRPLPACPTPKGREGRVASREGFPTARRSSSLSPVELQNFPYARRCGSSYCGSCTEKRRC